MQYRYAALSLLAVTGALAAPASRRSMIDNEIRVSLSDLGETGAQLTFHEGVRDMETPPVSGPFATIELNLGADVQQQDLRCQVLDMAGNPIVLQRGANTDITFGDGGKGPWTFRTPATVSEVICDPTFLKIDPSSDDLSLRVVLENQSIELGSQTVLAAGERVESSPVASSGPFETVDLRVGSLVEKQDYRCQVLDHMGHPIVVLRGENRDITFSDADKGAWTFEAGAQMVSDIICDPTFVKGST